MNFTNLKYLDIFGHIFDLTRCDDFEILFCVGVGLSVKTIIIEIDLTLLLCMLDFYNETRSREYVMVLLSRTFRKTVSDAPEIQDSMRWNSHIDGSPLVSMSPIRDDAFTVFPFLEELRISWFYNVLNPTVLSFRNIHSEG